jgi:hypothetical protein
MPCPEKFKVALAAMVPTTAKRAPSIRGAILRKMRMKATTAPARLTIGRCGGKTTTHLDELINRAVGFDRDSKYFAEHRDADLEADPGKKSYEIGLR